MDGLLLARAGPQYIPSNLNAVSHAIDTQVFLDCFKSRAHLPHEIESVVCATCDHYYQAEDFDDAELF